MIERFGLGADSLVVEFASNDGYLLQYFVAAAAFRCWASSRRRTWPRRPIEKGIPTLVRVLRPGDGRARWCADGTQADLIVGNNVLAQVPDLNDFVAGMKILLAARAA